MKPILLKLDDNDHRDWKVCAVLAGLSLSDWIRKACRRLSAEEDGEHAGSNRTEDLPRVQDTGSAGRSVDRTPRTGRGTKARTVGASQPVESTKSGERRARSRGAGRFNHVEDIAHSTARANGIGATPADSLSPVDSTPTPAASFKVGQYARQRGASEMPAHRIAEIDYARQLIRFDGNISWFPAGLFQPAAGSALAQYAAVESFTALEAKHEAELDAELDAGAKELAALEESDTWPPEQAPPIPPLPLSRASYPGKLNGEALPAATPTHCKHGTARGYRCWQCGGIAQVVGLAISKSGGVAKPAKPAPAPKPKKRGKR